MKRCCLCGMIWGIPFSIIIAFFIYKMDILVFPVKGNTQNCTLISNSYLKQPEDFVIYGNSIIFISHNKI